MNRLEGVELTKSFRGRRVLNRVSLAVGEGEIVGLLGPNGAGKTTTFYILAGLLRADSGQVWMNGEEISALPMYQRARLGLGYLPQEPSVFRKLSVRDNILAVLEMSPLEKAERLRRTHELMREMDILPIEDTKGYALSGGERRRVEIARALASAPSFILLDEPFSGIDPIMVADIQKIVHEMRDRGIGVLITDHNVRDTLAITDRAYLISEGDVIASGAPEEILSSERARKAYFGEGFSLGPTEKERSRSREAISTLRAELQELLKSVELLGQREERGDR